MTNEQKFRALARTDEAKEKFAAIVGAHQAGPYIQAAILAVANNQALQDCEPLSLLSSALQAATLQLSVDPNLGLAYLVPFGKKATLIIGYKGLVQLAMRTNKYRYINVDKLYEGEYIEFDRISGAASLAGEKKSDKIGGYVASFQLNNGFTKTIYMSLGDIHEHAKKYSKNYRSKSGPWQKNTQAMERKTPLRILLTQWGELDPHARSVLEREDDSEVIDAEFEDIVIPEDDPNPQHTEEELLEGLGVL